MKISYNWLKWYIPEAPDRDKLADIFTYHICEVESVEKKEGDTIFDINILPNRSHDLLSHKGVAQELASLLNISYTDPTPKYKTPSSVATNLKIDIKTDKCRRFMGRVVRNVKVGPSPDWVVNHLESIGERSINNLVDATNIVMYNTGQPTHCFDLDKLEGGIIVRPSLKDDVLNLLPSTKNPKGVVVKDKEGVMLVCDEKKPLALAGIKGGADSGVSDNTTNIILEVGNFDPISIRKTAQALNIFTDARKRFENDLSPELAPYAMRELSTLIFEMFPDATFEDIVDVYTVKQKEKKLKFSADRISKILGLEVSVVEIGNILERYKIGYKNEGDVFEIIVPPMRLDLTCEEDMAEEIGRILGYDKVKPIIPKINFTPKVNETYIKMSAVRNELRSKGYSEVMSYAFCDKGEIEVMQSASDKKLLRTNLADGLKERLKLNKINSALLEMKEVKIFEIGSVFKKGSEETHVAYNEKDGIIEKTLDELYQAVTAGVFSSGPRKKSPDHSENTPAVTANLEKFKMWSLYPFISRDIALWVPESVVAGDVEKIIRENMGELVVHGPYLFDEFKKDGKISYAFRLIFQSYERTLTDLEVGTFFDKITNKIKEKADWQIR